MRERHLLKTKLRDVIVNNIFMKVPFLNSGILAFIKSRAINKIVDNVHLYFLSKKNKLD